MDSVGKEVALAYRDDIPWLQVEKGLSSVYGSETVREAYKELDDMVTCGLLSRPDNKDEEYVPGEETIVKALCLHVAHDCNLRCR